MLLSASKSKGDEYDSWLAGEDCASKLDGSILFEMVSRSSLISFSSYAHRLRNVPKILNFIFLQVHQSSRIDCTNIRHSWRTRTIVCSTITAPTAGRVSAISSSSRFHETFFHIWSMLARPAPPSLLADGIWKSANAHSSLTMASQSILSSKSTTAWTLVWFASRMYL